MQDPGLRGLWYRIPSHLPQNPPSQGETAQAHLTTTRVPKGSGWITVTTPPLGRVPAYCSLFRDIITELVSKDNGPFLQGKGDGHQEPNMMTICSLQETFIKLELPSA